MIIYLNRGNLRHFFVIALIFFYAHFVMATTPVDSVRYRHLLSELRCLVCQNQDVADSPASIAQDLRETVYQAMQAGKTDQEIKHYLTQRYGDYILLKPPMKPMTWLLWWGPGLFLLTGFFMVWRFLYKG